MAGVKCWICGRTKEDVESAMSGDLPDEIRLRKEMKEIKEAKADFLTRIQHWIREAESSPFKDFNYEFVLSNPDQFNSLQFLNNLVLTNREMVQEFSEVAYRLGEGDIMYAGHYSIQQDEKQHISEMIGPIEKKWGLSKHNYDPSARERSPSSVKQAKIKEGLTYLQEIGATVYDFRMLGVEGVLKKLTKSKPAWQMEELGFKKYTVKIPVCTVCRDVIGSMRPTPDYDDD